MPLLKPPEGPQRPSSTIRGSRHVRTSSSDSDPLHRSITDRTPRLSDHRSPRGTQSDPLNQKKLGTRIMDLETQLGLAQHELKSLKHQLSSAEAERKHAQEELHKRGSKKEATVRKAVRRVKPTPVAETRKRNSRDKPGDDAPEEIHRETDVFEVPVEKMLVESKAELSHCSVEDLKDTKSLDSSISEPEKPPLCVEDEADSKSEEIDQMRAVLEEKVKELQVVIEENETLKKQLNEAKSEIALACSREEEMALKVDQLGQDLEMSKAKEAHLKEKLVDTEAVKELLEIEMNKMKVQTEQWRKAADAAASVLAGGVDMKGRISERCASMDNHFNSIFEPPPITGFGGYPVSPGAGDDPDDSYGGGKKKGSGIRMLGDLWKKKGHK
ncbi:interactor of constitutive active ROPs 4 [Beta vulgaris subsp. vulgaris]|uniref:interactor of constitutive active ROPs 4 n=1 Tax=Beta vulgaris subsp. vulgaris TaxID=3555 RepID=UPI0020374678|nr:interactor of constitutive active ROPs 4 [Beta vulgaris subsp. vulgaris]XP_048498888.1 interactor of constitutive active ROPs 4 [Beta vulgaris subsp. vulgaris]